jgi:hypothetical protein
MNIYIDCEFNDFQGALISMALVAQDGREFYGVLLCADPSPWVKEHVMSVLVELPIAYEHFQEDLAEYLAQFERVNIIADWPEDIAHFCQALITGPGYRMSTPPLTMEVRRDLDAVSKLPHNALEDARAIRLLAIEKGL